MAHDLVADSAERSLKVVVLLCETLESLGHGLYLQELRSWLETSFPDVVVEVVPELCRRPDQFPRIVAHRDAARAVLGLCSPDYPQVELQAQARKAGLDPFGLEVVSLGTLCARVHPRPQATAKAKVLLAAAVARAQAFPGSGPENAKWYFLTRDQKVSRRGLFTLPPISYQPVPSIRGQRCVVKNRCQLCVQACPRGALERMGGQVHLDKVRCQGCGVCLTACPRGAVQFPGWSLVQFEAHLATLLDPALTGPEPCGLLFTCQRTIGQLEELASQEVCYSHRWLPVPVPCLGMVTPAWILQSLAQGAGSVAFLSCDTNCLLRQQQVIEGRVAYCRELLHLLGQSSERLQVLAGAEPQKLSQALRASFPSTGRSFQSRGQVRFRLGTLKAAWEAIQCLAGDGGVLSGLSLSHSHSPFGVVKLQAESCTGCGQCARVCPTGALALRRGKDEITLTYAAPSCIGCGFCVEVCPEAAAEVLQVYRETNANILSRGRVVVYEDRHARCEGCGATIAPESMLRRIQKALTASDLTLSASLARYCSSCRLTHTNI